MTLGIMMNNCFGIINFSHFLSNSNCLKTVFPLNILEHFHLSLSMSSKLSSLCEFRMKFTFEDLFN